MIKRFFIKLLSFVLCAGILAAGGYLSYTSSDFAKIEKEYNAINEAPFFADMQVGDSDQTPEETPEQSPEENPEETPEETPEQTPENN